MAAMAHPDRPLDRGFARITDDDGRTLTTAKEAGQRAHLHLRFADGAIGAVPDSRRRD